jgi:hypothetical protein
MRRGPRISRKSIQFPVHTIVHGHNVKQRGVMMGLHDVTMSRGRLWGKGATFQTLEILGSSEQGCTILGTTTKTQTHCRTRWGARATTPVQFAPVGLRMILQALSNSLAARMLSSMPMELVQRGALWWEGHDRAANCGIHLAPTLSATCPAIGHF